MKSALKMATIRGDDNDLPVKCISLLHEVKDPH